jgi:hypothetical protein
LSANEIIPSAWLPIIQLAEIIGVIIAIITATVRITLHITNVEANIRNEATRLDGRINVIIEKIDNTKAELQIERQERSSQNSFLFTNAEFLYKIGEKVERNKSV